MLQRLIAELGDHCQVLEIDATHRPDVTRYWNVLSVPMLFVLDHNGKPRHVHYGTVRQRVLRTQLLRG